jgi:hypothetical protein
MSQTIFTVTAIDIHDRGFVRCRCFGYFHTDTEALVAVTDNSGDLQECKYTHIVIEKQHCGIHAEAVDLYWFEWIDYVLTGGEWVACDRPKVDDGATITNFNGIG